MWDRFLQNCRSNMDFQIKDIIKDCVCLKIPDPDPLDVQVAPPLPPKSTHPDLFGHLKKVTLSEKQWQYLNSTVIQCLCIVEACFSNFRILLFAETRRETRSRDAGGELASPGEELEGHVVGGAHLCQRHSEAVAFQPQCNRPQRRRETGQSHVAR